MNANFVKHLEKRDEADGTSHADTWRKGLIHGPRAPFTVPYTDAQGAGDAGDGGGADGAVDTGDAQDHARARHPTGGRAHGRDGSGQRACRRQGPATPLMGSAGHGERVARRVHPGPVCPGAAAGERAWGGGASFLATGLGTGLSGCRVSGWSW